MNFANRWWRPAGGRSAVLSAACLLVGLVACGDDPVAPDWCGPEEADFFVDVAEDVVFRWAETCALEEILVLDDLGRVLWVDQGVLRSPVVFGPAEGETRQTYGVIYSTPDWEGFAGFAIGRIDPTGRWVSTEPFSTESASSTLELNIDEVDAADADNGRALWNFLAERILSATWDAEERRLEFLLGSSFMAVTASISEDGQTLTAVFSGTLSFGATEVGSFNGDAFSFERR